MLRVGLTGELGSGKSTVARLLAGYGAVVLSSDEMAREMTEPNQPVYRAIVNRFGPGILLPDGTLNRPELARLAFRPDKPRVEELNAIIHPAVIAEQESRVAELAGRQPATIVVVESALLFTTKYASGEEPWRKRFDRIVLVTAPDNLKVERFLQRSTAGRELSADEQASIRADANSRLAAQRIPPALAADCVLIENTGSPEALARRTEQVFRQLREEADHVQQ